MYVYSVCSRASLASPNILNLYVGSFFHGHFVTIKHSKSKVNSELMLYIVMLQIAVQAGKIILKYAILTECPYLRN